MQRVKDVRAEIVAQRQKLAASLRSDLKEQSALATQVMAGRVCARGRACEMRWRLAPWYVQLRFTRAVQAAQAEEERKRLMRDEGYSCRFAKAAVAREIRQAEEVRKVRQSKEAEYRRGAAQAKQLQSTLTQQSESQAAEAEKNGLAGMAESQEEAASDARAEADGGEDARGSL